MLISIINGNKDRIPATLGLILHQIIRKPAHKHTKVYTFKKSTYYPSKQQVMTTITLKIQEGADILEYEVML